MSTESFSDISNGILVDKLENGGVMVEAALAEFHVKYQTLFFIATIVTSIAGFFAALYSLFGFHPTNFINSCFQLLLGVMLILLDVPGQPRWSAKVRNDIRKQARILSKLTGKSLSLLFLSCLTSVTLWPYKKSTASSGLLIVVTFLICLSVACVAGIGFIIALEKSIRLNKVKKNIITSYATTGACNPIEIYRCYATSDPLFGMQVDEFNRLVGDRTSHHDQFSPNDLSIIFNALDDNQKGAINEREFVDFLTSTLTLL
ncbi:hypothetical protein ACR3K2_16580 [Cryptosporidium serpentis]